MRSPLLYLALTTTTFLAAQTVDRARQLVDPFIGTGGHGHTFPGACVPNGLVQLSPDTRTDGYNDWDGCGGYHYSDSIIHGFSHTHLSGTGVPDLCDVLVTPWSGTAPVHTDAAAWASSFSHADEKAHAGYYRVQLKDARVKAELSATARTGVHRYSFAPGERAYLRIDLAHRDQLLATSLQATPGKAFELSGERRSSSWARDQRLFFVLRSSVAPKAITIDPDNKEPRWAVLDLGIPTSPVTITVGISATDVDGARKNLLAESPKADFDATEAAAAKAWNAKLDRIAVKGGTAAQQRIFYTALYHCYVAPYVFNDVDGRYRGMDGQVHKADHPVYTVFSLWDTFRALHPLMTILEPEMTTDWINTFLLHYKQSGRLPVWELWGNETDCMIGYHSVSVISDAYLKGIRGFDAELALEAMVASAMRDEPGLNAYRAKGYISSEDVPESVSKTLEYAYDDWCIARMAEAMGKDSLTKVFYARGRNWQNVLDPSTRFFRARYNGGFNKPFDPYEVNFDFTEANAWHYSMFAMHDLEHFQRIHGPGLYGHLNELFSTKQPTTGRHQSDITGLIGQYAHGNEPSHHMAYLYRNSKGQELVRRILNEQYSDKPDGLSGNEDCGQMSAWYVMSAMGLYPVAPGMDRYWTGSTIFDEVVVKMPHGRSFTTLTASMNGRHRASEAQPWPSITHERIMRGGSLNVTDGPVPDLTRKTSAFPTDLHVPPAAIINGASSFLDQQVVMVTALPGPWVLHAIGPKGEVLSTADEELTLKINLDGPGTIKAWTVGQDGVRGPEIVARFVQRSERISMELDSKPADHYPAGGPQALIDGIRGGTEFRTGEWQGFEAQDLRFKVDLGEVRTLERAGLSVLQDPKSWIWYPASVTIAWSTNDNTWDSVTIPNPVGRDVDGAQITELWSKSIGKKARFISVSAPSAGPCPPGHPGAGNPSWIFSDEFLLELK